VQAALLEAMQEKQVTIGGTTFKLEEPFSRSRRRIRSSKRNVSASRGAGRSLHAQAAHRLSDARRRGDHAPNGERRSDRRAGRRIADGVLEARHASELHMDDRIMDYTLHTRWQ
jgi:MoxR-like ATPase